MKIPFQLSALSAAALLISSTHQTLALEVPVDVVNAGFESPALTDGTSQGNIPGWSNYGTPQSATAWNPENFFFPNGIPEGYNVGDLYVPPALTGFTQTLQGAQGQFQADATYRLKIMVGRNDLDAFDGYLIQLIANEVVLAQDDNSQQPEAGSFAQSTITYDYDAALHSTLVGEPLEIRLLAKGLSSGLGAVSFDRVQLTYETLNAVADHGGPYRLSEDEDLILDGTGSLPADGASSIVDWDWDLDNDGSYDDLVASSGATISYNDLVTTYGMEYGENTIGLRVEDDLGNIATGTTTVTIYQLYTYTGPNAYRGSERWFVPGNWDTGMVPEGVVDVEIPASITTFGWDALIPEYTGNLYLNTNSVIQFGWTTGIPQVYNMMGTPGESVIYMGQGSKLRFRMGENPQVPEIVLNGDAEVSTGESTQGGADADFDYPVSGNHQFTVNGNRWNQNFANMNAVNTFASIRAINGITLRGNVAGSLGLGNVTINGSSVLEINAISSLNEDAAVSLNTSTSPKIVMNADNTCAQLVVQGAQWPAGTYGSPSSTADNKVDWIGGTAILTVTESPSSYWDPDNGATAGTGSTTPTGTWGGDSDWTTDASGSSATNTWAAGSTAAFSAGADATGSYTVTVGQPSGITVTKESVVTGFMNVNSPPTTVNDTIAWTLEGGNCVVVLISGINSEGFTATYDGQAMTVVGALSGTRNAYSGIAYIISDSLPASGDVVINMPYDPTYSGGTNTGGYGHYGYVYSILSLSGVQSAGTHKTYSSTNGDRNGTTLTYSTAANNGFVVGVGSDNNWRTGTKSVTGLCSTYTFQSSDSNPTPGYYNTVQGYGTVPFSGSYSDLWEGQLTSIITLPFEAKPASNPSYTGQTVTGLRFEDGTVTLDGDVINLQSTNNLINVAASAAGIINTQLTGSGSGLEKRGSGVLTLSDGTNDYGGTTKISVGTLRLGADNVIPNTSDVEIAGRGLGVTATLDLDGNDETITNITLAGTTLTSASAITTGAGTLTLGSSGTLTYSAFDNPLGATISGNLALSSAGHNFLIADSSATEEELTISAAISGTGGFTKYGFGTLVLDGNHSYTGLTTIEDGTAIFSGSNASANGGITVNNTGIAGFESLTAINGSSQDLLINSGGLVYFGPSFGAGNIPTALAGRVDPTSAGVIAVDNFTSTNFNFNTNSLDVFLGALNNLTYTGTFTPKSGTYRVGGGPGILTLSNANALTGTDDLVIGGGVVLTNTNDLSGDTTISSGFLQIGNGGTVGSLASSAITNNSVLVFKRSDLQDQGTHFQGPITGSGIIEKAGSGTLVLDAANTYSGGTTLFSGGLEIGHATGIGSGPLTILNGTMDVSSGAITLSNNNDILLQGSFTYAGTDDIDFGTGELSNYGDHTITLGGSGTTFTVGGTAINATDLSQSLTVNGIGNTLVLGGYEMSIDQFATNVELTIDGTGNLSITGAIEDWSPGGFDVRLGSVIMNGSGTLTLSANNNYTGQTVINNGLVDIISGSQTSDILVNSGGTLGFTLGSSINTSGSLTLEPGHAIKITGTPSAPTEYTLMTATNGVFAISPTLADTITGYMLSIDGNNLMLVPEVNPNAPLVVDITDDRSGADIVVNQTVTYTIEFDKDMDDSTFSSADFANAGTSSITIGTITETDPGIFTVEVTPTTTGTLRLQIPTTAVLTSADANDLEVDPAINDNTTIEVYSYYTAFNDWSGSALFGNDANSDGIANGLAWILGASDVNADVTPPIFDLEYDAENPDFVTFYYSVNRAATDAGANPLTRYTSDLSSWTTAVAGPSINITTFSDSIAPGIDLVQVDLNKSLAVGDKMFIILSAEAPPDP